MPPISWTLPSRTVDPRGDQFGWRPNLEFGATPNESLALQYYLWCQQANLFMPALAGTESPFPFAPGNTWDRILLPARVPQTHQLASPFPQYLPFRRGSQERPRASMQAPDVVPSSATVHSETELQQRGEEQEDSPSSSYENRTTQVRHADPWDHMFRQLVKYKERHGDCLVDAHDKDYPDLGMWATTQRQRQNVLSPEHRERLESVGFVWQLKQQATWGTMYDRLLKYRIKHGNCMVPQRFKEDPRLGEWVQTQRRDRNRRKNLSPEREARLDSIGFNWCPQQFVWDSMFERLEDYHAIHGHCLVPRHYSEDPKLGRWVDQQRVKNKKGRLSDIRKELLDSLDFIWRVR